MLNGRAGAPILGVRPNNGLNLAPNRLNGALPDVGSFPGSGEFAPGPFCFPFLSRKAPSA